MSCILRAADAEFDVDAYLATSPLRARTCKIWHVGEKFLQSRPPSTTAGFNAVVSDTGLDAFKADVRDAINFLREHHDDISRLVTRTDISGVELDFGVALREDMVTLSCRFPPELVVLAASLKLTLVVSYYACAPTTKN
jgi:hypothetical protein